jgi:hypothetical protein
MIGLSYLPTALHISMSLAHYPVGNAVRCGSCVALCAGRVRVACFALDVAWASGEAAGS